MCFVSHFRKNDEDAPSKKRNDESPFGGKESEDSYDREYIMERYANSSNKKSNPPQSPKYQFDDEREFGDEDDGGKKHPSYIKRNNKKSTVSPKQTSGFVFNTALADNDEEEEETNGLSYDKYMA